MDAKKTRKPPRWGVRHAAQAHCLCGWRGAHWYGEGAMGNAHGELRGHREKCRAGSEWAEPFVPKLAAV